MGRAKPLAAGLHPEIAFVRVPLSLRVPVFHTGSCKALRRVLGFVSEEDISVYTENPTPARTLRNLFLGFLNMV